jgi:hypothetical protein
MTEHAPFAGVKPPFANAKGKLLASAAGPLPGQVMNEHGEWEDEASFIRRGEEAVDSVREKLLRCRRLYLMEISGSAGKRAAFEILTELPIDWEKAARLEPQPDEPWHRVNMHQPDMILTAENGWSFGEWGYGDDKKAQLRADLNEYLVEQGENPVDWGAEDEPSASSPATIGDPPSRHSRGIEDDRRATGNPASSPAPQDKVGPRLRSV